MAAHLVTAMITTATETNAPTSTTVKWNAE